MNNNDFLKLAERLGWSYNLSEAPNKGQICVELEKFSPQGQDFIATIWFEDGNERDFINQLHEYWQDFDPDKEATKWIGEDGHGMNGAPYSLRGILADMEECKDMLCELFIAFRNRDIQLSKDEQYAVNNILSSIDNVRIFAEYFSCEGNNDSLRKEIEEMADHFKKQVHMTLRQAFLAR